MARVLIRVKACVVFFSVLFLFIGVKKEKKDGFVIFLFTFVEIYV